MDQSLREQLQHVIAAELTGPAARFVIEEARKDVDARHQDFLDALNLVVAAEKALADARQSSQPHARAVSG
jgi:hypothetical protein